MTSIEWLIDQLEQKGDMRETSSIRNLQLNIDTSDYLELKRQAKEIHKQEIIDAWEDGAYGGGQFTTTHETSEQYYQETFVNKGSDYKYHEQRRGINVDSFDSVAPKEEKYIVKVTEVELPQQETLYTEEQVREAIELARETRWIPNCGNQYPYNHTCDEIIQSLKQPKN